MVAVLCGGSAATVYAPHAYQSRDADFVISLQQDGNSGLQALASLGYVEQGSMFVHPKNVFTVEFPAGPLSVGEERVTAWETLRRGSEILYIVSRTNCIRDRLAHFYFWNDFKAFDAAVAVARADLAELDLRLIREWTQREDAALLAKFEEFERRLT